MIKVMVVDDVGGRVPEVLCRRESEARLVAEAATERDAVYFASGCDVALVNVAAQTMDIPRVVWDISHEHPKVKVLMLGVPDPDRYLNGLMDYIAAGACGYITTTDSQEALLQKIRAAHKERAIVSSFFAMQLIKKLASLQTSIPPQFPVNEQQAQQMRWLTKRQREVLALIAEGDSNAQIGSRLGITEGTVKNHVSRILKVLEVDSRAYAAAVYHWIKKQEPNGRGHRL